MWSLGDSNPCLRHTTLTLVGRHGVSAAELQARAGHASQAAMGMYQHATLDRDLSLAETIGQTYDDGQTSRESKWSRCPRLKANLCHTVANILDDPSEGRTKASLLLTNVGKAVCADPPALWRHFADKPCAAHHQAV